MATKQVVQKEALQDDAAQAESTEKVNNETKYKCEQDVLYDAGRLGWDNYERIQPQFALRSDYFTMQVSTDAKKAIDLAEAMPDKASRQLAASNALTEMERLNPLITTEFQFLELFIRKAYPNTAEAELAAAGGTYFAKAIKQNWGATESLARKAKSYMEAHLADLTANNNMPTTFPDAFNALGDAFIAQRSIRNNSLGTSETGTTEKIQANNAVYDTLIKMLEFGKLITKNNKTEEKKFVFEELKKVVKGRKPAGAEGKVKAEVTNKLIANATLSARNLNPNAPQQSYSTTTDDMGKFFLQMASGEYEITISAPGFTDIVVPKFKVKIGTKSRLNPVLAAMSVATTNLLADAVESMSNGAAVKDGEQVMANGVG